MRVIKKLLIVLITVVLLFCSVKKLNHIFRPTDTDGAYSQIQSFYSVPKNTVEVISYGSSHSFSGLSTMEMYEKYGIGAYNYAWNWQQLNTTHLFIKDSLLYQKPKVILIETFYVNQIIEDEDMNAQIYYTRYLSNKEAIKEYLCQCFGNKLERYITYQLPILQFHDNWTSLNASSFHDIVYSDTCRKNMGFSGESKIEEIELYDYTKFNQYNLCDSAIKELDGIVSLCKENDIKIVFYTVPWQGEYNYSNAMKEYAKNNDCVYFNFFELAEEIGLDTKKDFCNWAHLNENGAKKVANYIGKYLSENYELTDMRKIDNNPWQQTSY